MDTTVTRIAYNSYGSSILDGKCLTCLNSEACLGNTLKSDLGSTAYSVVTTEEYTTVKVSYVNLRVLNYNIVACACIYTDDIKVKSCCIFNNDLRTVKNIKVRIVAVKTDEVSTRYACSNKLNVVKCKCLVSEHPEYSGACLYRRINYDSTVLECGSTEVEVILCKSKGLTIQIDNSRLSDSGAAKLGTNHRVTRVKCNEGRVSRSLSVSCRLACREHRQNENDSQCKTKYFCVFFHNFSPFLKT